MSRQRVFTNATVVTPDAVLENHAVICAGERIEAVVQAAHAPAGSDAIDCGGDFLAPGTIDVHIHGADGAMVEEATADAVATVARALPRFGATGFLATFATSPLDLLRRGFAAVRDAATAPDGARVLGIHLEGPYLNPDRAGAQPTGLMRAPDADELAALLDDAGGLVKLVTLAPELAGGLDLVACLRARGIIASAGHTDATAEQMHAAIDAGVRHGTHLFNAMRGIHHREPGAAGVLLADERVTCELICDGHHLHRDSIHLALRAKPRERVVLVTDAVAPMGQGEGEYDMFGVRCIVRDGCVRLAEGGNLAGSVLSLDVAIRNLHRWFPDVPLHRLWRYAATNPADELGLRDSGRIAAGAVADLVRYTSDLEVRATYRGAECVYAAEPARA